MRKVTDFIVNHCYIIFICILVLTGICGFLATKVNINKDIYSYMPTDSETSLGLAIMDEEFDYSSTSSYEMMITDVPEEQKLPIKEHLESIEGVKSVDYDASDQYNRDQYTLYKITVDAPADSDTAARVYSEIHGKYSEEYEIVESGKVHDYNGSVLKISTVLLAVGFAMIILIIMSKSWVEPFLFLFAILLAVVMNKGTNIIFPSVSHITDAIAAILQMALSMDYAIMLSTRYRQEKASKDHPDKYTAMRRAMRYSFGAICSSSVTTVVGLIVLVLMSFTIGRDMGLVLSKGVVLSLVSIFTSLPALLLLCDKLIEKTAKKTINFKMNWAGRLAHAFSHFAFPVFLVIFIGAFMLKGDTLIDYTASQNNKINDIFNEPNQMALVYDGKMDEEVTKLCYELDARAETARVLCYGNTINEPEKYNEIVPKINELGSEKVDTEDYLIKALYYNYYKDVDSHTIAIDDFVKFLQRDVFPDGHFANEIDSNTISKIEQLSYFTDQIKVNQPRTKEEIASILGVDSAKLDDVLVLYLASQGPSIQLTSYQFAQFVSSSILTDSRYSSMLSASQRSDLAKLLLFSNSLETDSPKTAAELANMFGISQDTVEKILLYYTYSTITTPTVKLTPEQLINFALTDETALGTLGIDRFQAANLLSKIAEIKDLVASKREELAARLDAAISSMPDDTVEAAAAKVKAESLRDQLYAKIFQIETILTSEYSYDDIASIATKLDNAVDLAVQELSTLDLSTYDWLSDEVKSDITAYAAQAASAIDGIRRQFNLPSKLSQLRQLYSLYQAETTVGSTTLSPRALVDFLISHADDSRFQNTLTSEMLARLQLVQYIMNNQSTAYSYSDLALAFGLAPDKLRLVYALYEYRFINTSPRLSLKTLVNFINDTILPNPEYASRLSSEESSKLSALATIMHAAEAHAQLSYKSLYHMLVPLAGEFDIDKLFLAYLYHGSLYDYDESWTLTLETFVNYLAESILPDAHFISKITDDTRQKILDGQVTVQKAKDLLVGPNHYRALIETNLPAEGEDTFNFIKDIKSRLGPSNKTDYFLLGDSAMAYEMSQSFGGEMDFITIITMLAIFIVVVFTFRSLFVSVLLVLIIQCAVYIVMAYLSLTGSSIYFIALIIVQAILMGATIDYAILFTSYYIESRSHAKLGVKDALVDTYNKSIGAILTSASILIIVTAIVGNFTSAIAGKICQSISLGTFCATVIILCLLPALLATLDKWIIKKAKH